MKSTIDPSKIEINIPTPEEQERLDRESAPSAGGAHNAHDEDKPAQPGQKKESGADEGSDLEKLFKQSK